MTRAPIPTTVRSPVYAAVTCHHVPQSFLLKYTTARSRKTLLWDYSWAKKQHQHLKILSFLRILGGAKHHSGTTLGQKGPLQICKNPWFCCSFRRGTIVIFEKILSFVNQRAAVFPETCVIPMPKEDMFRQSRGSRLRAGLAPPRSTTRWRNSRV
jgi:hypothetical protein